MLKQQRRQWVNKIRSHLLGTSALQGLEPRLILSPRQGGETWAARTGTSHSLPSRGFRSLWSYLKVPLVVWRNCLVSVEEFQIHRWLRGYLPNRDTSCFKFNLKVGKLQRHSFFIFFLSLFFLAIVTCCFPGKWKNLTNECSKIRKTQWEIFQSESSVVRNYCQIFFCFLGFSFEVRSNFARNAFIQEVILNVLHSEHWACMCDWRKVSLTVIKHYRIPD